MKGQKIVTRVYYKYQTQTFNQSSSFQSFVVPQGTKKIQIDCVASKGADGDGTGGNGGRVQCFLPVTNGQTLYFYVGATNSDFNVPEYNASDIRTDNTGVTDSTSLSSRLVVAGGGGSSGITGRRVGGQGGGLTGGNADDSTSGAVGKGGTQTEGGAAGSGTSSSSLINLINSPGEFGLGGVGIYRMRQGEITDKYGGAGGAGWYGGGGGGRVVGSNSTTYYGGGGGSSYTDPRCWEVIHTQGYNNGTGYITIVYPLISTASDYDFYEDFYEVKVIKETSNNTDTYYGIKEYKRGQYYGN